MLAVVLDRAVAFPPREPNGRSAHGREIRRRLVEATRLAPHRRVYGLLGVVPPHAHDRVLACVSHTARVCGAACGFDQTCRIDVGNVGAHCETVAMRAESGFGR
ncbi:hypothetical protein [Alloactinosynnema sp. L-07]|nr:hypothetical protein [Alloactinosynnema sp. L-07]